MILIKILHNHLSTQFSINFTAENTQNYKPNSMKKLFALLDIINSLVEYNIGITTKDPFSTVYHLSNEDVS